MEQPRRNGKQRTKAPQVPIPTYKWEDVRRSRLKGGYPWTYLYKDQFNENIDPEQFKMSESRSVSTLGKSTNNVDILELPTTPQDGQSTTSQENLTEPSSYIVITEVPSDLDSHSKSETGRSINIQEETEMNLRADSESSDNISQYLDKDEPDKQDTAATATTSMDVDSKNREERSKSEEPKRKRKLSIDSSYSRKSLSKLGILKKLKEAADKIKVPKLTLPTTATTIKQDAKKEQKSKTEPATKQAKLKQPVDEKPVYIHIPLKPPPGQTDEFSYLEFGEKKPVAQDEPEETKSGTNSNRSSRLHEDDENKENEPIAETEIIEEIPPNYDQRRFSGDPNEIVAIEILRAQSIDLGSADLPKDLNNLCLNSNDPNANQDDVIIILSETEDNKKPEEKSLSRQSSKRSSQKGRAKSAEPERKRKLSLESSYSRKSLSKLAILQKLRDAKEKFKISNLLSPSGSKKQSKMTKSEGDLQKAVEVKDVKKVEKTDEPKYIHIPLKPPPGQTDEFSYLEFEEKQPTTTKIEQISEEKETDTPVDQPTDQNSAVQFIFLTPPSDDEILDSTADVPETPTSEKQFEVEELKKIAQGAIDKVSPESKRKLESVKEELKTDEESSQARTEETLTKDETCTDDSRIIVDEEDGLKSSEPIVAKQEQELKSSLKASPVLKKKVSFKRRSRDESKDGIYEDVEPRKDETDANLTDEQKNKLQTLGTNQSMSVDEEKTYLDEEKIIKSTSLEEDYNRWSKISDHEYEPVNPPPDNVSPQPPSIEISPVKLVSQENNGAALQQPEANQEPSYTIQEIQTQIEEKFFKPARTPSPPPPPPPPAPPSPPKETTTTTTATVKTETKTDKKTEPGRFQQAIKNQADKFKSKLVGIKKPTISMPTRPKFDKFKKFETPKFNLPKIPDTAKIHLPTFGKTQKTITKTTTTTKKATTPKRSLKQRQFSTESNIGDSKRNYFDFRTYPRIFKKKPRKQQDSLDSSSSKDDRPEFATLPKTKRQQGNESWTTGSNSQNDRWGGRDIIRIPLHGEESFESNDREEEAEQEDFASHIRYDKNIDIDDAYERENREIHTASPFSDSYNSRWNHGTFHPDTNIEQNQEYRVTDLDSPEEEFIQQQPDKTPRDVHSSESSLGIHRRGVLEEIDSDEFFLRQKGISQDNIEVGMYLSSEIREAFKSPTNALSDLQTDMRTSNQSLPETTTKKKSIKKPKRKKTPHVSQEQLPYGQDNSDSEQFTENLLPARPKRRSKRGRKQKDQENIIPYQETVDVENMKNMEESIMYENQQMEGKEQPEIKIVDPYADLGDKSEDEQVEIEEMQPEAPPRRQRSLKSLNYSEHDSIMDDVDLDREFLNENVVRLEHEYIIPTPDKPPVRPSRLHSRSSSNSRDINREYINQSEEVPVRPPRTRSQSRTRSDDHTSRGGESLQSLPIPCAEEPCVQDLRDYMGYAIIDKQQRREPPLPPPRSSSRIKQRPDRKFFTVARTTEGALPPRRPLRNYSTLGPNRPPRRKLSANMTDEEKQSVENLDVTTQYIEIENDQQSNRDLNSGEILQKMRDRPLPAPPRPPRKIKHDHDLAELEAQIVEVEVSTQTEEEENVEMKEPEEVEKEEKTHVEKRLITPTHYSYEETITHGSLVVEPLNGAQILPDSQLIKSTERTIPVTRSEYGDEEETSEIPEEFKQLKNPPQPPQERPASALTDHEVELVKTQKLQVTDLDVDRLSVNELMANKIIVSEIESSNLYTNEISSKSGAVRVGEIELPASVVQQLVERLQSLTQEQSTNVENLDTCPEENDKISQKKTPIEQLEIEPEISPIEEYPENCFEEPQTTLHLVEEQEETTNIERHEEQVKELLEPPLESDTLDASNTIIEETTAIDANIETLNKEEERLLNELKQETEITTNEPLGSFQQIIEEPLEEVPPQRPPRSNEKPKLEESDSSHVCKIEEPAVDDEPPPRPPQPPSDYIPSQPPASFYALRAQQFVDNIDDNIPIVPRRRRHYKTTRTARTSSSDDDNDDNGDNRHHHHHHHRRPSSSTSRRRCKSPEEPTIPQLTGQLISACCTAANSNLKRLIVYVTNNYLGNPDSSNQDLNVLIVLLLILIAGLILMGYGDGKTVHHHHWEYFNPPTDL